MGESVKIGEIQLSLSTPDEIPQMDWIGGQLYMNQILAAWHKLEKDDVPLNPQILGKPGVGKTTLAYSAAKKRQQDVYIFQCTLDTRPEDLLITPVIGENNTIQYHASSLVTAMIKGGVCILDEGNRMSEKSWASLAPLLDSRRYIESIIAGIKIKAHPEFRICVTMNEDSSTFEIPEYIHSRLQPQIFIEFPSFDEEYEIVKYHLPFVEEDILVYLLEFLSNAHKKNRSYSVRDGISILRYYEKLQHMYAQEAAVYEEQRRENRIPARKDHEFGGVGYKRLAFPPKIYLLGQAIKQVLSVSAVDLFELSAKDAEKEQKRQEKTDIDEKMKRREVLARLIDKEVFDILSTDSLGSVNQKFHKIIDRLYGTSPFPNSRNSPFFLPEKPEPPEFMDELEEEDDLDDLDFDEEEDYYDFDEFDELEEEEFEFDSEDEYEGDLPPYIPDERFEDVPFEAIHKLFGNKDFDLKPKEETDSEDTVHIIDPELDFDEEEEENNIDEEDLYETKEDFLKRMYEARKAANTKDLDHVEFIDRNEKDAQGKPKKYFFIFKDKKEQEKSKKDEKDEEEPE